MIQTQSTNPIGGVCVELALWRQNYTQKRWNCNSARQRNAGSRITIPALRFWPQRPEMELKLCLTALR